MDDVIDAADLVAPSEESKIDQAELEKRLTALKALDLTTASVAVYVIEISTINKLRRCKDARHLECVPDLLEKFRCFVTSGINAYGHISTFTEIHTNQDNRFFHVEKFETDFPQVLAALHPPEGKEEIKSVAKLEELRKFNAYVIEMYMGPDLPALYGFRYVSQAWSPQNSSGGFFRLSNDMVASIDETPVFRIDNCLDFIAYGEDIFIMNSNKFESAMQFKERLVERKAETVVDLAASQIFVSGDELTLNNAIGTDKHLLRQLSSVQQKGYYKNPNWVTSLRTEAQAAGNWLLEFDAKGKIVVKNEKAYVRELLIVLQNKRVQTVVDKKVCDVDGELTDQVTR